MKLRSGPGGTERTRLNNGNLPIVLVVHDEKGRGQPGGHAQRDDVLEAHVEPMLRFLSHLSPDVRRDPDAPSKPGPKALELCGRGDEHCPFDTKTLLLERQRRARGAQGMSNDSVKRTEEERGVGYH